MTSSRSLQALKGRRRDPKSLRDLTEKQLSRIIQLKTRKRRQGLVTPWKITLPQYRWIRLTLAGEVEEMVVKKLGYSHKSISRYIIDPLCVVFNVPNRVELIRKVGLLGV